MEKKSFSQANFAVGMTIRYFRKKEGYSQQDLADHLGMARVSTINIEAGKHGTPIDTLYEIASFLGCSVHDLIPVNKKPTIRLKLIPGRHKRYTI